MGEPLDPAWPDRPEGWRHDAPDPPESFPVPWSPGDGLALVAWILIAQLLVGSVLATAGVDFDTTLGFLGTAIAVQLVTLGGAYLWLRRRRSWSWRLLGPVRPASRFIWTGIGVGISGVVLVVFVLTVLDQILGPLDVPTQEALEQASQGGLATVLGIVVAVLIAPVLEELIFRGVLFQTLRHRLGLWPGMVLSGLVFGFIHLEFILSATGEYRPAGFVPIAGLTILGVWFAGAFHRSGSLVTPIVGHAAFNGTVIALSFLPVEAGLV